MMVNISVYCSRYHCCNVYTLTDLNIQFQKQQHLFTLNCNKNWRRHQLVLEFYLFNVQKQFLCLWYRLSSTTGKLHLSNYCIQHRGKGTTAWQHLSVGTLQGLAFWVLITKVSSHSKKTVKQSLAQRDEKNRRGTILDGLVESNTALVCSRYD